MVDATTAAGSIRSELDADEFEAAPEGGPRVRVRSGAGSIRISRALRTKAGVL